jgi:O-antigen ligase
MLSSLVPMQARADDKYLGMYVLLTSVAVCLFVAPFNSIDPVNLPKLCLLVVLSFIAAGFAFSKIEFLKLKRNRAILLIIGFFILQLFIVLLVDDRDFALKFYGTSGRNTGFIAYLSLSFLLLASLVSSSKLLLKRYVIALLSSGAALALYGIAQSRGYDFFEFDLGIGTKTFGSFGNSNFQSAYMGITAAAALTLVVYSGIKIYFKAGFLILICLAIYNVSLSSEQGYFNFVVGIASATVIFLFKSRKPILGWIALAGSSISVLFLLLGVLKIGPLAEYVYKSSLSARRFYWQAAGKMMTDHPFFGVGMDGYGDAYMRSRPASFFSSGFFQLTDTAHSIPLDIGSNGGFPLFIAYVAIIIFVLLSIVRIMKRKTEFDVLFATIVAAWVAYQAQSLISINQLGLGVWGWSLSGLIIGYELNTRPDVVKGNPKATPGRNTSMQKISASAVVMTFIATSAGIGVALPPYLAANEFYKALQSGDANVIQPAAYLQPYDRSRFTTVARILQENKLEDRAIMVLRDASKIYPDSFEIWNRWAGITSATPNEIALAKAEMKRLDPFNPNLK